MWSLDVEQVSDSDPEPHQRKISDQDPHQRKRSDPDPHQSAKADPERHQRDADPQHFTSIPYLRTLRQLFLSLLPLPVDTGTVRYNHWTLRKLRSVHPHRYSWKLFINSGFPYHPLPFGSLISGLRTTSILFMCTSVADPGCLSRIPDPDFYSSRIPDLGSRIQKQQQKRGAKKNLLPTCPGPWTHLHRTPRPRCPPRSPHPRTLARTWAASGRSLWRTSGSSSPSRPLWPPPLPAPLLWAWHVRGCSCPFPFLCLFLSGLLFLLARRFLPAENKSRAGEREVRKKSCVAHPHNILKRIRILGFRTLDDGSVSFPFWSRLSRCKRNSK